MKVIANDGNCSLGCLTTNDIWELMRLLSEDWLSNKLQTLTSAVDELWVHHCVSTEQQETAWQVLDQTHFLYKPTFLLALADLWKVLQPQLVGGTFSHIADRTIMISLEELLKWKYHKTTRKYYIHTNVGMNSKVGLLHVKQSSKRAIAHD